MRQRARHGEALAYYLAHVDDETEECVVWPFASIQDYGVLWYDGRNQRVHILACERHYGPKPQGAYALHLPVVCHTPSCFNWRHLRWGTQRENIADELLDGTRASGERSGHARLTWEQVREIRLRYATGGVTQQTLAIEYGMSQMAISDAVTRRRWKSELTDNRRME